MNIVKTIADVLAGKSVDEVVEALLDEKQEEVPIGIPGLKPTKSAPSTLGKDRHPTRAWKKPMSFLRSLDRRDNPNAPPLGLSR